MASDAIRGPMAMNAVRSISWPPPTFMVQSLVAALSDSHETAARRREATASNRALRPGLTTSTSRGSNARMYGSAQCGDPRKATTR